MRTLWKTVQWLVIGSIILAAGVMGLVRLLLPMADQYRADIERWASAAVGGPVRIGGIDAQWRGFNPYLRLEDVSLLDQSGARTLAHVLDTRVYIDVPGSLRQRSIQAGGLEISAATLYLERRIDGSIGFTGTEQDRLGSEAFSRWLAKQGQLHIADSQLYWSDARVEGAPQRFANINLELSSDGQRHHVEGALELPEGTGNIPSLTLDFSGAVGEPQSWVGNFLAQGEGVALARWMTGRNVSGIGIGGGQADFAVRGSWSGDTLTALKGDFASRDLYLKSLAHGGGVSFRRAAGHFAWQRDGERWTLLADRLTAQRAAALSIPASFKVTFALASDGAKTVDTRFDFARLEDLAPLLLASSSLKPKTRAALAGLQPRAELHDFSVQWRKASGAQAPVESQIEIQGRVTDFTALPWKRLPAVANMAGQLQATQNTGSIDIDADGALLAFDEWYDEPFRLSAATGLVRWRRMGEILHVETEHLAVSDTVVSGNVKGSMEFPEEEGVSPLVDLTVTLNRAWVTAVPRYIPSRFKERTVAQWLDRALLGGRITSGHALIQGRLKDFPFFGSKPGNLEADFAVSDAALDYVPEWPRIDAIEAVLSFRSPRFELHATEGTILDSKITEAHVVIPEMGENSELTMQGKLHGASAQALAFVRQSPLKEKWGEAIAGLNAEGSSVLNLDMALAFPDAKPSIKGALALTDNTLLWKGKEPSSAIKLSHVDGTVNFTEASLAAKDIKAQWDGQTMRLDMTTEAPQASGAQQALLLEARGTMLATDLIKRIETALPDVSSVVTDILAGETDWSASVRIHKQDDDASAVDVAVRTDLQGMAIDLPEPLGKLAEEKRDLRIGTTLSEEKNTRVNVRYADRFGGAFEATKGKQNWELGRGELRFGSKDIGSLPARGLRISGEIPRLSVSAWDERLSSVAKNNSNVAPNSGALASLNDIDLRFGSLELAGQIFADIHIDAAKTSQAWEATLSSTALAGKLRYTSSPNAALRMDFERIHLAKTEDGTKKTDTDPRAWPALAIDSASFKYGGLDLGKLSLVASKHADGLRVDKLELSAPAVKLTGTGDWSIKAGHSVSRFAIKIAAEELGKTLTGLGYDVNIVGGQADFELNAEWPGSPAQFTLAKLKGSLAMDIEKGRLLDVEPGAGRIFGLLSMQTLPRRLTLDFSDLFAKGFVFDHILGEFKLDKGNAYTDSLIMVGPSANIIVTGRTGLAAKDYEQIVTVRPEIDGSLALAGALAGGPGVGAAIYLAQQLFKTPLSNIGTRYYRVTGPWEDPVFTSVAKADVNEKVN